MKLTLYLIQQEIDTYAEVKALTKLQQKQLTLELEAYFGKKTAFKAAFDGECIANFWQACHDGSNAPLYDFWEINGDSGGVFHTGTTNTAGVEMIQGSFDVQAKFVGDQEADLLADALAAAERTKRPDPNYELNEQGEVTAFRSQSAVPSDPKQWNRFLKDQKAAEVLIRQYQAAFNKSCWSRVCQTSLLSEAFLAEFANKVNWDVVSQYQQLSEDFIRQHRKRLNWTKLSFYQKLSESFLREFQNEVDWGYVSSQQVLSEAFIREFSEKLSWPIISWAQRMSEDFIREFQERIDLKSLFTYQRMPESFLREFVPKFDWSVWYSVSGCQILPSAFIDDFADSIQWGVLSMNPFLTDEQLRIYRDKLDWNRVAIFGRTLSEPLLREFQEQLSQPDGMRKDTWIYVIKNPKKFTISKEFKQEILEKINQKQ